MGRCGLVVRLMMLAACLVPFTSVRQASAVISTSAPAAPLPAPTNGREEETEREEESESDSTESVRAAQSSERPPRVPSRATIRHARHTRISVPAPAPVPADPFRNGLGTPYRC